jgi:hypothetical protein
MHLRWTAAGIPSGSSTASSARRTRRKGILSGGPNLGYVADDLDIDFAADETAILGELRASLKQVAEWPPESPLNFVLMLASRTRGKLGEMLVDGIARRADLSTAKPSSVDYDRQVGSSRCEIKFSTEDPPRFQQVRDPRLESSEQKYDHLICVSGRPHGLVYWIIPATVVGTLMDEEKITVQHAMSNTKWFLPSRAESDDFSAFRFTYEPFVEALKGLA